MFKRLFLAALCLISSPAAFAACTASIDYDAGLYGEHQNLDGVGWGSLDAERQNESPRLLRRPFRLSHAAMA